MSWLARHAARYINQPGVTVRQCPPSRDLAPLAAAAPSLGSFLESMRALVPSLADMGLLAVPKRKVRCRGLALPVMEEAACMGSLSAFDGCMQRSSTSPC